jgi:hypothetical protein
MHLWTYCLVLTPAQRDILVAGMEAQSEEAAVDAKRDNDEFRRRLNEINKDGVKVISGRALALEAKERAEKNGGSN